MNVHEAVERAKAYAGDLFATEGLIDPRLEEVELDEREGVWNVTIGILRPLDPSQVGPLGLQFSEIRGEFRPGQRIYRVVRVRDRDGSVLSVKMREEVS